MDSRGGNTCAWPVRIAVASALAVALSGGVGVATASAATTCSTKATSDFDGDGRSDLVVGVPGKRTGAGAGAGTIAVFHGSASGQHPVRALSQSSAGVPGAGQAAAHFGALVETGDFDGDGCADALVFAPGQRGKVQEHGGAPFSTFGTFTVFYGRAGATLDARRVQFITDLNLAKSGLWAECEQSDPISDGCAEAMLLPAVGDFNGDHRDDVALIRYEDPDFGTLYTPEPPNEGVVIIPGKAKGLDPAHSRTVSYTGKQNAKPCGDIGQESVSTSVGDVNADGADDLAVGCYYLWQGETAVPRPFVSVYYGSSKWLDETKGQTWTQATPGVPGTDHRGDGVTTTFGDFNHDGYIDLAVGHPPDQECTAGKNNKQVGSVSVIYGTKRGLSATHAQLWRPGRNGVPGRQTAGSRFGEGLAAGDFNGDGDDELVIRDPSFDGITVLPGTRTSGIVSSSSLHWNPNTGGIPGATGSGDAWGAGLLVGNFGYGRGQDLVVVDSAWHKHAGSITELFGSTATSAGLRTTHASRMTEGTPGVPGTVASDDYFGGSNPCFLDLYHILIKRL